MSIFAFALALSSTADLENFPAPPMPADWSQAIDTSAEAYRRSITKACTLGPAYCDMQARDAISILKAVWEGSAVPIGDKDILIQVLKEHTAADTGTNWSLAKMEVERRRMIAMRADGRATPLDQLPKPVPTAAAPTYRTSCYTSVSKNGRRASSWCASSPR